MLANRMRMGGKKVYDSFTKTLLHFDGANTSTTFKDEIGRIWTPNGTAQINTSLPKFGSGDGWFTGTDWIDTPDSVDFTLGSNDFTFDFWHKRGGLGTLQYVFGQMSSGALDTTTSVYLVINTNNTPQLAAYSGSTLYQIPSSTAIGDTTTWHHIAVVRSGVNLFLFQDGVQTGTVAIGAAVINDSAFKFTIGRAGEYPTSPLNGYIDEFRFSKGIARWTANFTPPTSEY